MFYTDTQGNKIKMPKWTMALAKMQDKIESNTKATNEQLYTSAYKFMHKVFTEDFLTKELDGISINDIDLTKLMYMYKAVCSLYAGLEQPTRNND